MDYATRVGDIIADKRMYRPTQQETTAVKTVLEVRPNGPNGDSDEAEVVLGDRVGIDIKRSRDEYEAMTVDELRQHVVDGNMSITGTVRPENVDEDDETDVETTDVDDEPTGGVAA